MNNLESQFCHSENVFNWNEVEWKQILSKFENVIFKIILLTEFNYGSYNLIIEMLIFSELRFS
jgi:hypothetical protein